MTSSRREFMQFLGHSTVALAGFGVLSACASSKTAKTLKTGGKAVKFSPIPPSDKDDFVLSPSFSAQRMITAGDTINAKGEYFGYNNDFIGFLPFEEMGPDHAFLWVNHESPNQVLLTNRKKGSIPTKVQAEIEQENCGGSILHIKKSKNNGNWEVVKNSKWNRRVSGRTKIPFASGIEVVGQKYAMGTFANCSGGVTPWGTFLSCEENYNMYYGERDWKTQKVVYPKKKKYDLHWWKHFDYPPEHYGWVVEVDPRAGKSKKLTGLGRFAHEGATVTTTKDGRAVVYSGDDKKNGFLYKFIADRKGTLESGTLYVADFVNKRWLPLDVNKLKVLKRVFKTQTNLMVYAREAATLLGATALDRPEGIAINPINNDVIVALTNNSDKGNYYGSLLRVKETSHDSLFFEADTLLAGGEDTGFACPDNIAFDANGNLWFTCDVSSSKLNKGNYKAFKNNSMFVVPMYGSKKGQALRVAAGPTHCELTGVCFDHDFSTLFVSVQGPGGRSKSRTELTSNWPNGGNSIPRPAVMQIFGEELKQIIS